MPEDERGRETPFVVVYLGKFGFGVRIDDVESFGVTEKGAYLSFSPACVVPRPAP